MNLFGLHASKFLNATQNPAVKLEEIKTNVLDIYHMLENGQFSFPNLTDKYKDLLYALDFTPYRLYTELMSTRTTQGVSTKIGFNPIKIMTSYRGDASNLLDYLPEEYKTLLFQLNELEEVSSGVLYNHRLIGHMLLDIEGVYLNNILRTKSFSSYFEYIYNYDSYNGMDTSAHLTIPYIACYLFMLRIYTQSSNFPSNMISKIFKNLLIQNTDVVQGIIDYIDSNSIDISENIANFLINNIFLFGNYVSSSLKTSLMGSVIVSLNMLRQVVYQIASDIIPADFIALLSYDTTFQLCNHTVLQYLHTPNPDLTDDRSLYDQMSGFWDFPDDSNYLFSSEENRIYNLLSAYLVEKKGDLEQLQFISYQYKSNPLFFLNSHFVTHQRFCSLMSEQPEPVTPGNVINWLEKFKISATGANRLYAYLVLHPMKRRKEYEEYVRLSCFIRFREVIVKLCDSDEFTKFITNTLLKDAVTRINSEYYYTSVDLYQSVDLIKTYFKSLFMKEILTYNEITRKYNMFGDLTYKYDQLIAEHLDDALITVSPSSIMNLLKVDSSSVNMCYYVFDSFFKGAFSSLYLEKLLGSYSL